MTQNYTTKMNKETIYCMKCNQETEPILCCHCPERQPDGSWRPTAKAGENYVDSRTPEERERDSKIESTITYSQPAPQENPVEWEESERTYIGLPDGEESRRQVLIHIENNVGVIIKVKDNVATVAPYAKTEKANDILDGMEERTTEQHFLNRDKTLAPTFNPFTKFESRMELAGYKSHPNGSVDTINLNSAVEIQEEALTDLVAFMLRHQEDFEKEFKRFKGTASYGQFVLNLIKNL